MWEDWISIDRKRHGFQFFQPLDSYYPDRLSSVDGGRRDTFVDSKPVRIVKETICEIGKFRWCASRKKN